MSGFVLHYLGTSLNELDYEAISTVITFSVGSIDAEAQCLNVTIIEDALVEGNETFFVTLTLLTTELNVTTENDVTVVTITDNEGNWRESCTPFK